MQRDTVVRVELVVVLDIARYACAWLRYVSAPVLLAGLVELACRWL